MSLNLFENLKNKYQIEMAMSVKKETKKKK